MSSRSQQAAGRKRSTGPGLGFWHLKAHRQWHTSSNKVAPTPTRPHPMNRWESFSFKPPQTVNKRKTGSRARLYHSQCLPPVTHFFQQGSTSSKLLTFTKQRHQLGPSDQNCEPMEECFSFKPDGLIQQEDKLAASRPHAVSATSGCWKGTWNIFWRHPFHFPQAETQQQGLLAHTVVLFSI